MAWRDLEKGEEEKALAYVRKEPEINLFISGDLLAFGLDGKHVRARIEEKEGRFAGILLRYMNRNYVYYTEEEDFPAEEIAHFIKEENPTLQGVCLSGKSALIERVAPFLKPLSLEKTMMARAWCEAPLPKTPKGASVRFLTKKAEFEEAYDLESTIQEFVSFSKDKEETVDGFLANYKRGSLMIGVYEGGRLVALASTTADTAESAMLVGVCTKEGYRKKGYASLAVGSLLQKCHEKGQRFVYLFYDNPLAGRIYHAFGFVDIAPYSLLH